MGCYRILLIIESSSQEALSGYLDSLTVEQSTMNIVQQSTVCSILQQVSTPIFMVRQLVILCNNSFIFVLSARGSLYWL